MTIRLLIAEDHDMVREGLRTVLEETDIDVVGEATTGADAIDLALASTVDVLLLDIKMPNGDGFHVLQAVKPARPNLAVLIYTQHDRLDFQDRARTLGASGYLTKRTSGENLIDAIRKVSLGERLWDAGQGGDDQGPGFDRSIS